MRIESLRFVTIVGALALAALAFFSCDDNPSDGDGSLEQRISIHSGDGQLERIGAPLPEPLVVKVSDILGKAKPGILVEFSASDEPSAVVTPRFASTDKSGLASCTLTLGTRVGTQHVRAITLEDSTFFDATAVEVACPEENPSHTCTWANQHILIATTSSSLLDGGGSVVFDFDPYNGTVTELFETDDPIIGISFSSRGELFIATDLMIGKVTSAREVEEYISLASVPSPRSMALEPNPGGVLVGLPRYNPVRIDCAAAWLSAVGPLGSLANILWENLAVDPVTRDIYLMTGGGPTSFVLWRLHWDGRSADAEKIETVANLSVGAAEPRGMCADSSGTIYIVFDGNDNWRRIVSVAAGGVVDYDFFNFFSYYGSKSEEPGRWGDIAYRGGRLYVIDRRNDRLVVISKAGEFVAEHESNAFSMPLVESEQYAICAAPMWICITK